MIIPVGFGQVNFQFTGGGVPQGAEITFGFSNNADQSAADCAQDFADAWGTSNCDESYSASINMTNVHIKLGPNATGPQADLAVSFPGVLAGSMVPPNTAFLIRKVTEQGGRQGRGRFFIPGVPEADVDSAGGVLAVRVTALDTIWNTFGTTVALGGLPLVLLHSDALAPTQITGFATAARVATQRRRLR